MSQEQLIELSNISGISVNALLAYTEDVLWDLWEKSTRDYEYEDYILCDDRPFM